MSRRGVIACVAAMFAGAASPAVAQFAADSLPAYQPVPKVAHTLRMWGHGSRNQDFIGPLVRSWEKGFRERQPGVDFDTSLKGDKSAIGGLYTGASFSSGAKRTRRRRRLSKNGSAIRPPK